MVEALARAERQVAKAKEEAAGAHAEAERALREEADKTRQEAAASAEALKNAAQEEADKTRKEAAASADAVKKAAAEDAAQQRLEVATQREQATAILSRFGLEGVLGDDKQGRDEHGAQETQVLEQAVRAGDAGKAAEWLARRGTGAPSLSTILLPLLLRGEIKPGAEIKVLRSFGSLGSGAGQFNFPRGVAVDGSGNIFVADGGNGRVQVCLTRTGASC